MKKQPILLFGGSFDPVHNGHVALLTGAIAALKPSISFVFPAGNPWQKTERAMTDGALRVDMLRLAFEPFPGVMIDDRELYRKGATYTIDTLLQLRAELGAEAVLTWLIGSDAFAKLASWHRAAELPGLTHFAVARRAGEHIQIPALPLRAATGMDDLCGAPNGTWLPLTIAPPATSSTEIRARVATGRSIRGEAPEAVCEYIDAHKLYR
jgi:nicotinate-nucleotide adenylyltransferase